MSKRRSGRPNRRNSQTPAARGALPALPAPAQAAAVEPRRFLMCRPAHFAVTYTINPWMDTATPVDAVRASDQWERLRDVYLDLGHQVELISPEPGLPDMVFAANGATVLDGVVYSAQFRYPQRAPEGAAYLKWFADHGFITHEAELTNEGEGDFLLVGDVVLAGWGQRTERAAHREAETVWNRKIVSLELVDPRFYHLDTALAVLDGDKKDIAYYPPAFSPSAQEALRAYYPDAYLADKSDAEVLGLNALSDTQHVVVSPLATRFIAELRNRGYDPIEVDTSELLKAGGGAKCCTLHIR